MFSTTCKYEAVCHDAVDIIINRFTANVTFSNEKTETVVTAAIAETNVTVHLQLIIMLHCCSMVDNT